MARSAFAIDSPATLILAGAAVVAIGTYVLKKRGPKEIPSSAVPPAYLPGLGAAPALGASSNLGVVRLATLFDPKIIVLRPGGQAQLKTFRQYTDEVFSKSGDRVTLKGIWTAPAKGDEDNEGTAEPFMSAAFGLWNIGGPGASRIRRSLVGAGINESRDLLVQAPSDWTKNDWAQLRLYRADVELGSPVPRRAPDGFEYDVQHVESVRIRTDLPPVQIVWIMGAY